MPVDNDTTNAVERHETDSTDDDFLVRYPRRALLEFVGSMAVVIVIALAIALFVRGPAAYVGAGFVAALAIDAAADAIADFMLWRGIKRACSDERGTRR